MAITYVGKSSFASGTGALTVGAVSGVAAGDLLLLFVESANQPVAAPTGYTQVTNSPVAIGTAAAAGGVALQVFYAWATGSDSTTSVADSGDHTTAIKMAFRGVSTSTPFDATPVSGTKATASTSSSYPGITTATANAMVVYASALDLDAASTATTSSQANANLTSITERHDQTVSSGFGGGLVITTGMKATAGATGNLTATVTSTTQVYLTLALRPAPPTITGDLAVSEPYSMSDTAKFMAAGTTWPATGVVGDLQFAKNLLLLHMDGAEGSTSVVDVCGHTMYSDATLTSTNARFGQCALFTGSQKIYASTPDLQLTSGSLSIEFDVYLTPGWGAQVLVDMPFNASTVGLQIYVDASGYIKMQVNDSLSSPPTAYRTVSASDSPVSTGVIHRVEFSIDAASSTIRGFLDGVPCSTTGSMVYAIKLPMGALAIGRGYTSSTETYSGLHGYIDEFRLSRVVRNTATYAVPTSPFPDQLPTPGPATAQASLTGTLTSLVAASLGAGLSASALLTSSLTTSSPIAASLAAAAGVSAGLTTQVRLASALAAAASAQGALTTAKPLAAVLSAQTGIQALLQSQAAALQAALAGAATLGGGLTTRAPIQAALSASGTLGADLTTQIRLAAALQAGATVAGEASTQIRLGAVLAGQAGAAGALTTQILAQASLAAGAQLSGELTGAAAQLATQMLAQSALSGSIASTLALSALLQANTRLQLVVGALVPLDATLVCRASLAPLLAPTARSPRGWLVPAQLRAWPVGAELRRWSAPAQGLLFVVPAEARVFKVSAEGRQYAPAAEVRRYLVPADTGSGP